MGGLPENIIAIIVSAIAFSVARAITGFVFRLIVFATLVGVLYFLYNNGEFDKIFSTVKLFGY